MVGAIGLAIPNFLLALVLMVTLHQLFDLSVTGLFSREYRNARATSATTAAIEGCMADEHERVRYHARETLRRMAEA